MVRIASSTTIILLILGLLLGVGISGSFFDRPAFAHEDNCPESLNFGEVAHCSIGPLGEEDTFDFVGAVDDLMRIRVVTTFGDLEPEFELRGPDGSLICEDSRMMVVEDAFLISLCVFQSAFVATP